MKRRKLDPTRKGIVHKATIGGTNVYFRTGEFPDGTLGEIFITLDKHGGMLRAYDAIAILLSWGLQHGAPLGAALRLLEGQKMEPAGVTSNPEIPIAQSICDYLARWLKKKYLKEEKEENDGNQ
jgi:ribonucleoside-diphosphate reductase alpha chain